MIHYILRIKDLKTEHLHEGEAGSYFWSEEAAGRAQFNSLVEARPIAEQYHGVALAALTEPPKRREKPEPEIPHHWLTDWEKDHEK